jgi:hypothetical protein
VAPRRAAALGADAGQTSATPVLSSVPGRLVVSSGIRQNLGADTNEDEVFVIARDEATISSPPQHLGPAVADVAEHA